MSKISIDNGGWFDPSKTRKWSEDDWWDGHNYISRATGTQWEHESLYRTRRGAWVLHSWCQWQGSGESYMRISEADAHAWLLKQGHGDSVPNVAAAEV
jgi:hypothetical protein